MSLNDHKGGEQSPPFHPLTNVIETHARMPDDVLIANFHSCMARGLPDVFDLPDMGKSKGDTPIALVGGGPSLKSTMGELREIPTVMACGSSHDFLVNEGIPLRYAVSCDGDPVTTKFYTRPRAKCMYLLATNCHPDLFNALHGFDVVRWHNAGAIPNEMFEEGTRTVGGGCMVTLRALSLAIILGYRNLHFFGFDSCYTDDQRHAYDHCIVEHGANLLCRVGASEREFLTTPEWLAQAQHYQEMCGKFGHLFDPTIHGDGLIAEIMREGAKTGEGNE